MSFIAQDIYWHTITNVLMILVLTTIQTKIDYRITNEITKFPSKGYLSVKIKIIYH